MDGCEVLGITADEMDAEWAKCKKAKKLVKFGGGFYCGLIEMEGKPAIYVFNGFFMSMRAKFTVPGESIYYYSVEWESVDLSWADFRGEVLGPTDPAEAPWRSLRGMIAAQWESLGLKAAPNVGDNGVHASASPFEAFAERANWLGADIESDPFGQLMLGMGLPKETISEWSVDPQVANKRHYRHYPRFSIKKFTPCARWVLSGAGLLRLMTTIIILNGTTGPLPKS